MIAEDNLYSPTVPSFFPFLIVISGSGVFIRSLYSTRRGMERRMGSSPGRGIFPAHDSPSPMSKVLRGSVLKRTRAYACEACEERELGVKEE